MRSVLLLLAALVPLPAFASGIAIPTGVPTSVKIYNSNNVGVSCEIVLGSTTYLVNDTTGNFGATCMVAMLARVKGRSIGLYEYTSGGNHWAYGVEGSSTTASVQDIKTNDFTLTSSADQCLLSLYDGVGYATGWVDDGGPEEDITCTMAYVLQYSGRSGAISRTAYEVDQLTIY